MATFADLFKTCYLTSGSDVEFSKIRVHYRGADEVCRAFGAMALTIGSDIYFRDGAFAPHTSAGLRILAHEVAHVVQQHSGPVAARPVAARPVAGGLAVAPAGSAEEHEAEAAADALLSGRPFAFAPARSLAGPPGPDGGSSSGTWPESTACSATWTPRSCPRARSASAQNTWKRSARCSSGSAGIRGTSTTNACGPSIRVWRRCACPEAGWW